MRSEQRKPRDVLDQTGCTYEVYTNIKENPTIANVQNGVQNPKKAGADFIVSTGGGSPVETAKAIGIIINNPFVPCVKVQQLMPALRVIPKALFHY